MGLGCKDTPYWGSTFAPHENKSAWEEKKNDHISTLKILLARNALGAIAIGNNVSKCPNRRVIFFFTK